MPEGMLESFSADDRRDLIGYLMHSQRFRFRGDQ